MWSDENMNKPLVFPLIIMFVMSLVLFTMSAIAPAAVTGDYSDASGITIDDEERTVLIPAADSQTLDIWAIGGFMVLILAGVAIGITAGVGVLGSGLSDSAQRIIVVSFIYLGMWACLTVITSIIMWETTIGTVTWLALTIIFLLGVSSELTGSD